MEYMQIIISGVVAVFLNYAISLSVFKTEIQLYILLSFFLCPSPGSFAGSVCGLSECMGDRDNTSAAG